GSPALEAGSNPAVVTFDQRGAPYLRVSGVSTDIGAYERPTTIVTFNNDSGKGSLRQAIANANSLPGTDTITFAPSFFGTARTITLSSGEIAITDPVVIQAPGATLLTVSGNNAGRIFNTTAAATGTTVSVSGMTLTGGKATGDGGAILI